MYISETLASTIRIKYLSPEERKSFNKKHDKQVRYWNRKQLRKQLKGVNHG